MIITTILIIAGMLAGFYSGFYFGYLKREDKPPVLPLENEIKALGERLDMFLEAVEPRTKKEDESSFFD
jgi:hypothetical protein